MNVCTNDHCTFKIHCKVSLHQTCLNALYISTPRCFCVRICVTLAVCLQLICDSSDNLKKQTNITDVVLHSKRQPNVKSQALTFSPGLFQSWCSLLLQCNLPSMLLICFSLETTKKHNIHLHPPVSIATQQWRDKRSCSLLQPSSAIKSRAKRENKQKEKDKKMPEAGEK